MSRYGALLCAAWCSAAALGVLADCPPEREQSRHDENRLHEDLTCAYNSDMRPVTDHKDAVIVKVRFAVKYLTFDSLEEMVTVHSWVAMTWNDPFLTWTPSDYGDLKEIQMESHEIWTPRMALFNADASGYNTDSIYTTCLVKYDGKVTCVPHLAHTAICRTSIRRWPYDVQNCTMFFGSWMHTGEQVNYTFYNVKPVVLDDFQDGPGWKLSKVVHQRLPGQYYCCPNSSYPMLKYTFMLTREAVGLSAIIVAPAVILVLVTLSALLLDVEGGTRLIVLCFSLYGHFTLISEIGYVVPKMGTVTPIILLFVRDSMVINLSAILLTMVLTSLRKQVVPAPAWIVSLNRLASFGPGKYIVFTEYDPSEATEGKMVEEDSRSQAKNSRAAEWITFSTVVNTLAFAIAVLVYLVLICTYIPSED